MTKTISNSRSALVTLAALTLASFGFAQTIEKKTLTLDGAEQVIAAAKSRLKS